MSSPLRGIIRRIIRKRRGSKGLHGLWFGSRKKGFDWSSLWRFPTKGPQPVRIKKRIVC